MQELGVRNVCPFDYKILFKLALLLGSLLLLISWEHSIANPTQEKKANLPLVRTYTVKPRTFSTEQTYPGTVVAQRWARLFSQETGKITVLPFHESDYVKQGQLLVQLDDSLLRAELAKANALHQQAQLKVKRLQTLIKKQLVAQQELDQANTELAIAKADIQILTTRLGYTKINAPFNAIITERLVEPHDIVSTHTHVLTLIDPTSLLVSTQVFDVVPIEKGMPVSVQIDALNHHTYAANVERFYPATTEANSHLFTVEIKITPLPAKLQLGQFCRVYFQKNSPSLLAIPYVAIQRDFQGEFVFIINKDNQVIRQAVQTGSRFSKQIEITQGLAEEQHVVTHGFLGLKVGQQVKIMTD